MAQFEVDSERVAHASSQVRTSSSNISSEVEAMMRHLQELQMSWKGSAAAAFQDLTQQWRHTQEQVRTSLDEINQALTQVSANYAEVESAAQRAFAR